MAVQTIPDIDEMTPAQQVELLEALWKSMSERGANSEPPEWHGRYLDARENALREGDDEFVSVDEFEKELRDEMK